MAWLVLALLFWAGVPDDAHARAVELFHQHKYAQAIPALQAIIGAERNGSAAYVESAMLIGQSYFMLSQAPKAIPWLERVPPTNESSYMLGYAYRLAGQPDQSVAAFARLFGLNPGSAAAHLLAGQMLIKRELEDAGADEVRKALQIDPKIPQAHFVLAEIAMFHGLVADSMLHLQQELSVNPSFSMAWYRLGDAYVRQRQWDPAIANLQRAVWLNQSFSGSYILLGKCYYKKRDLPNAERFLRQAIAIDPKNYQATYYLGQTLIAEGHVEEGKQFLNRSAALREKEPLLEP